jgi:hypothetical protein
MSLRPTRSASEPSSRAAGASSMASMDRRVPGGVCVVNRACFGERSRGIASPIALPECALAECALPGSLVRGSSFLGTGFPRSGFPKSAFPRSAFLRSGLLGSLVFDGFYRKSFLRRNLGQRDLRRRDVLRKDRLRKDRLGGDAFRTNARRVFVDAARVEPCNGTPQTTLFEKSTVVGKTTVVGKRLVADSSAEAVDVARSSYLPGGSVLRKVGFSRAARFSFSRERACEMARGK